MSRTYEIKQKEVINVSDGRRLGFVSDVDLNLEEGVIESIIIPGESRLFGFMGKDNEMIISWSKVKKIGEDIILVDLDDKFLKKYFD